MTRNTCVSAFICGSHICMVEPSEFDSISVGPPSGPSTDQLSRHPSASIIGILEVSVSLICRPANRADGQSGPARRPDKPLAPKVFGNFVGGTTKSFL